MRAPAASSLCHWPRPSCSRRQLAGTAPAACLPLREALHREAPGEYDDRRGQLAAQQRAEPGTDRCQQRGAGDRARPVAGNGGGGVGEVIPPGGGETYNCAGGDRRGQQPEAGCGQDVPLAGDRRQRGDDARTSRPCGLGDRDQDVRPPPRASSPSQIRVVCSLRNSSRIAVIIVRPPSQRGRPSRRGQSRCRWSAGGTRPPGWPARSCSQ